MTITIIAAVDANMGIGRNGQLPWCLPEDLRHFRKTTKGHTVIMGRKTFDSFPSPLMHRQNIIVSRHLPVAPFRQRCGAGVWVCNTLDSAISSSHNPEIFIIGGSEIFTLALPRADTLIMTRIPEDFDCDTFFPSIVATDWELFRIVPRHACVTEYYRRVANGSNS